MPLMLTCGGCKRKLRIPDALRGKIVKCPHCAQKSRVPAQPKPAEVAAQAKPKAAASAAKAPLGAAKSKASDIKTAIKPTAKAPAPVVKKPSTTTAIKQPAAPLPADNFDPDPPAVKPRTAFKAEPPPPAPPPRKPVPTRRDADDDEEGGPSKLVILGGAFIGVFLIGIVIWYFFFTEAASGRVKGVVYLDGKPVEGADILFLSADQSKRGPYPAKSDKSGSFSVAGSSSRGGIPLGEYKVTVSKLVMPDGKLPSGPAGEMAREHGLLLHALPPDYADADKTSLRAVVKSGNNDIELKLVAGK